MSTPAEAEERVAAALVAVVGERGLAATDVEAVCERAGVERATFERCFGDLQRCYARTLSALGVEFIREAGAAFSSERRWRDQIRAVAYFVADYLQADLARARFVMVECFGAGEEVRARWEQATEALVALIDLGRAELGDPESLTRATAEAVAGAIALQTRRSIEADGIDGATELVPKMLFQALVPYIGSDAAMEELRRPVR